MSKKVLTGAERKAQMLEAGARLAAKYGAANVTRRMVAKACKCAESLVNVYMGSAAVAQKAYARKAKAMGLALPDKAKVESIGAKLRAHGPRDPRDTRKRTPQEKVAIMRKRRAMKVSRSARSGEFVSKDVAKAHPDTTVTETVARPKKPSTGARSAKADAKATRTSRGNGGKAVKNTRETKPTAPAVKPQPTPVSAPPPAITTPLAGPTENKSAARAPKAPPPLPQS